jgi:hypothetical protein
MKITSVFISKNAQSFIDTLGESCISLINIIKSVDHLILDVGMARVAVPKNSFGSSLSTIQLRKLLSEISIIETDANKVAASLSSTRIAIEFVPKEINTLDLSLLARYWPVLWSMASAISKWVPDLKEITNIKEEEDQVAIKKVSNVEFDCWDSLKKLNSHLTDLGVDLTKEPFLKLPESSSD